MGVAEIVCFIYIVMGAVHYLAVNIGGGNFFEANKTQPLGMNHSIFIIIFTCIVTILPIATFYFFHQLLCSIVRDQREVIFCIRVEAINFFIS